MQLIVERVQLHLNCQIALLLQNAPSIYSCCGNGISLSTDPEVILTITRSVCNLFIGRQLCLKGWPIRSSTYVYCKPIWSKLFYMSEFNNIRRLDWTSSDRSSSADLFSVEEERINLLVVYLSLAITGAVCLFLAS